MNDSTGSRQLPATADFCHNPDGTLRTDHALEIKQREASNRRTAPAEANRGLRRHEKAQALEQALDERGRR